MFLLWNFWDLFSQVKSKTSDNSIAKLGTAENRDFANNQLNNHINLRRLNLKKIVFYIIIEKKTVIDQSFLSNNNWTQSLSDPCLSTHFDKTHQCNVHLLLYVDDILLFSPSLTAIESSKSLLRTRFDISDGESATYILGVSIEHKQDRVPMCCFRYRHFSI